MTEENKVLHCAIFSMFDHHFCDVIGKLFSLKNYKTGKYKII